MEIDDMQDLEAFKKRQRYEIFRDYAFINWKAAMERFHESIIEDELIMGIINEDLLKNYIESAAALSEHIERKIKENEGERG